MGATPKYSSPCMAHAVCEEKEKSTREDNTSKVNYGHVQSIYFLGSYYSHSDYLIYAEAAHPPQQDRRIIQTLMESTKPRKKTQISKRRAPGCSSFLRTSPVPQGTPDPYRPAPWACIPHPRLVAGVCTAACGESSRFGAARAGIPHVYLKP